MSYLLGAVSKQVGLLHGEITAGKPVPSPVAGRPSPWPNKRSR